MSLILIKAIAKQMGGQVFGAAAVVAEYVPRLHRAAV